MLSIYLTLAPKRPGEMVKFMGEVYTEGILYLPREVWVAMGRPARIVVEVTPEEHS